MFGFVVLCRYYVGGRAIVVGWETLFGAYVTAVVLILVDGRFGVESGWYRGPGGDGVIESSEWVGVGQAAVVAVLLVGYRYGQWVDEWVLWVCWWLVIVVVGGELVRIWVWVGVPLDKVYEWPIECGGVYSGVVRGG